MGVVRLELQAGFTSGFGERLHTTVIFVMTTIELSVLNARFGSPLGQQLTNHCRPVTVATSFHLVANAFVACAGADNRLALLVIDDLASEMLERTVDAQPWLGCVTAQFIADVTATAKPLGLNLLVFIHDDEPVIMIIW